MKKEFYINEIERAKPALKKLLASNGGYDEPLRILKDYDIHIINTIQLLMYMGREKVHFGRKERFSDPTKWYIRWAKYMKAYDNTDKEVEIECISAKRDYKEYILSAVESMGIKL